MSGQTKKAFNFEVYTCNPSTGETGWDIKFPNIFAETLADAKDILRNDYPNFDVIILFNYSREMNERDVQEYANGNDYRNLEYINGQFQ